MRKDMRAIDGICGKGFCEDRLTTEKEYAMMNAPREGRERFGEAEGGKGSGRSGRNFQEGIVQERREDRKWY